jgi:hypothetical protein
MKTTLGILATAATLAFSSCSVSIKPDGSSDTKIDSESFFRALEVLSEK